MRRPGRQRQAVGVMAILNDVTLFGDFSPEPEPPTNPGSVAEPRRGCTATSCASRWSRPTPIALPLGWMIPPSSPAVQPLPQPGARRGVLVIGGVVHRPADHPGQRAVPLPHRHRAHRRDVPALPQRGHARAISYVLFRALECRFSWREALLACAASLVLLLIGRSIYRAWLTNARRQGRYLRDVIVVGARGEGADLVDLMQCHPDLGFRVVGVAGDPVDAEHYGLGELWLHHRRGRRPSLVGPGGVGGVVIAAGDLSHHVLNDVVRHLQQRHAHIHLVERGAWHRLSAPAGPAAGPRTALLRRAERPAPQPARHQAGHRPGRQLRSRWCCSRRCCC